MLNIGGRIKLNNLLKNILKSEIYEYNEFFSKIYFDYYVDEDEFEIVEINKY